VLQIAKPIGLCVGGLGLVDFALLSYAVLRTKLVINT
jgi:hypothetical protein